MASASQILLDSTIHCTTIQGSVMTQVFMQSALVRDSDGQTGTRKPWQTPLIEDADIAGLTHGFGTPSIEGPIFNKLGS